MFATSNESCSIPYTTAGRALEFAAILPDMLNAQIGNRNLTVHNLEVIASVVGGHAHRFRDTFAVELLLAGVPLDRVSVLLGHSSIRITERHYAPWTRSRQEQIEADLKAAWQTDLVIASGAGSRRAIPRRLHKPN